MVGVLVVMLLALALAGCGDERGSAAAPTAAATSGTATTARPPAARRLSGRALTRSALVSLDDFPVGWGKANVPAPEVRCGGTNPFVGARAVSSSKRIVLEQTGVQETVVVFKSPTASARAFVRMNRAPAMRCLRQDVRDEMSKEAGATASPLEVARVEHPGRAEKAIRFSSIAPSSIGDVRGVIDAVHMRVGRGIGALVIVSGIGPVDEAFYTRVLKLFSRRLRATFD